MNGNTLSRRRFLVLSGTMSAATVLAARVADLHA